MENLLASTLHIHSFSPIYNEEYLKKYLYNQPSHYGKYGIFDHESTCLGVSWCITMLRFASSSLSTLGNIPSKN